VGKGDWEDLRGGKENLRMVREIRLLTYEIDEKRMGREHVEYRSERSIGIRRNIAGAGRRFGGYGGLPGWKCMRRIQSVYIAMVCYGIEFITGETDIVKALQIINDCRIHLGLEPR